MSEGKIENEKKEEDCRCYAKSRTEKTCPPPIKNVTHPLRYYEFTQDEIRALEECDKESFYRRCLPFSTLFATATYAAIKSGHLRPNPRFGAFPKLSLAVVVGYFLGKLSYQQACAEKLMALPGSYIGQLLRDRRDGKIGGTSLPKPPSTSMFGAGPSDIYSDAGPGSSLDLDTDRPLFNDDAYRPNQDGSLSGSGQGAGGGGAGGGGAGMPPRPTLSYDELRRKNRGDYSDSKQDPYRMDPGPMPEISRARPAPPPPPSRSTNKYGDDME